MQHRISLEAKLRQYQPIAILYVHVINFKTVSYERRHSDMKYLHKKLILSFRHYEVYAKFVSLFCIVGQILKCQNFLNSVKKARCKSALTYQKLTFSHNSYGTFRFTKYAKECMSDINKGCTVYKRLKQYTIIKMFIYPENYPNRELLSFTRAGKNKRYKCYTYADFPRLYILLFSVVDVLKINIYFFNSVNF